MRSVWAIVVTVCLAYTCRTPIRGLDRDGPDRSRALRADTADEPVPMLAPRHHASSPSVARARPEPIALAFAGFTFAPPRQVVFDRHAGPTVAAPLAFVVARSSRGPPLG